MNTFVKIEFDESKNEVSLEDQVEKCLEKSDRDLFVSVVICGFKSWESARKLNDQVRTLTNGTTAFYCVNSSGLYGFAFADLGSNFEYQHASSDPEKKDQMLIERISDSVSMEQFFIAFLDESKPLTWKKRARNSTKMLFSAFICQYLKEANASNDFKVPKQDLEKVLLAKGHNAFKPDLAAYEKILEEIDRMFTLEFNPSSSVIGAVMS